MQASWLVNFFSALLCVQLIYWSALAQKKSTNEAAMHQITPIDTHRVMFHLKKASDFVNKNNDSSFFHVRKAYQLSAKNKESKAHAKSLAILGTIHFNLGNFDSSKYYLEKAKTQFKKLNSTDDLQLALNNLGNIAQRQSKNADALEYYHQALKLLEQNGNPKRKAILLHNIGNVYEQIGDYQRAMEYYRQSLELKKQLPQDDPTRHRHLSSSYNNIAIIHLNTGQSDSSQWYYEQALAHAKAGKDIKSEAMIINNLAELQINAGLYDAAEKLYRQAYQIKNQIGDKYGIHYSLRGIAESLMKKGNYDSAAAYALKSMHIAEQMSSLQEIKNSSKLLSDIYRAAKKYKEAIEYFEKYKWADDSLRSIEKTERLANLEARFELEQKQKTIELLEKDKILQQKILDQQRNEQLLTAQRLETERLKALAKLEASHRKEDSLTTLSQLQELQSKALQQSLKMLDSKSKIKTLENQQLMASKKFQTIIIVLLFIGIGMLLTLVLIIWNSKKAVQQINLKLQESNRQISEQTLELQALNDTKNKLFAIIAHDLKGPIAGLVTTLRLIQSKVIGYDEFMSMADELTKSTERVLNTMNNMLLWAQSQMKGHLPQTTNFDVNQCIQEVIQLINDSAAAKKLQIQFNPFKPQYVVADKEQVHIIMRNLLSNAIKYSHANGLIEIDVADETDYTIISVKDYGKGIASNVLANLFSQKTKSQPGTNNEKGTGLGLILSKEFATKNNGDLWVESQEGSGATFYLSLPKSTTQVTSQASFESTL